MLSVNEHDSVQRIALTFAYAIFVVQVMVFCCVICVTSSKCGEGYEQRRKS